ncbi:hypothetical protein QN413_04700 [Variovorax sp. LG9.2]|nr:hypothetical protein [Variovorax sp. LG9.2]
MRLRLAPTMSALALVFPGCALLSGCAVVSVASTVVSVGAGVVGLGADAVIGTARITGKAVGAAADAVIPGKD